MKRKSMYVLIDLMWSFHVVAKMKTSGTEIWQCVQ